LVKKIQRIKYFPMIDDFNLLTIYPGTEVYEIAKQKKFIDDSYWLTNKPTPLYLAENNLRDLSLFKEYLSTNLSVYKIFTLEGFKAQYKMMPFALKYFIKKAKSFKVIITFAKNFLNAQKK